MANKQTPKIPFFREEKKKTFHSVRGWYVSASKLNANEFVGGTTDMRIMRKWIAHKFVASRDLDRDIRYTLTRTRPHIDTWYTCNCSANSRMKPHAIAWQNEFFSVLKYLSGDVGLYTSSLATANRSRDICARAMNGYSTDSNSGLHSIRRRSQSKRIENHEDPVWWIVQSSRLKIVMCRANELQLKYSFT